MRITLGWVVSYAVGILLLVGSLILAFFSLWGIIPAICGLLILPIVRKNLYSRFNLEFSQGAAISVGAAGVLSVLVILSVLTVGAILDSDTVEQNGTSITIDGNGAESVEQNVSAVALAGQNTSLPDHDYSITAYWNATTQKTINPDPDSATYYSSGAGEKFLVLRLQLTNTGENDFQPDSDLFRIQIDGVEHHRQSLFGSGYTLGGVTQSPGSTREGWVAFKIPVDATEGSIITHQEAYRGENVSVTFVHDPEIQVDIPEQD